MKKELKVAHGMSQGYLHKQKNQWHFQGIDNTNSKRNKLKLVVGQINLCVLNEPFIGVNGKSLSLLHLSTKDWGCLSHFLFFPFQLFCFIILLPSLLLLVVEQASRFSIPLCWIFVPKINMSQNTSHNKNTTNNFNTMIILKFHY